MIRHDLLQVVSVTVDRDHCREVFDLEFPNGFRTAELFQTHTQNALNALCIDLCGAANGVKIYAAVFLAGLLRLPAHASFADNRFHAEALDDIGLIRFFAYRGCRSRRDNTVLTIK